MSELKNLIMQKLSKKVDESNVKHLFRDIQIRKNQNRITFEATDEIFLKRIKLLFEEDLEYILYLSIYLYNYNLHPLYPLETCKTKH